MWVTKLLISLVKIRIFCPRMTKFGPKLAFLPGLAGSFGALLVVVARAVSRKTPIYFIFRLLLKIQGWPIWPPLTFDQTLHIHLLSLCAGFYAVSWSMKLDRKGAHKVFLKK